MSAAHFLNLMILIAPSISSAFTASTVGVTPACTATMHGFHLTHGPSPVAPTLSSEKSSSSQTPSSSPRVKFKQEVNNNSDNDDYQHQQHGPRHVAFICDGNSRWATARNLPAAAGHAAGADRVWELLHSIPPTVTHCTLYAFSTENWNRSVGEVAHIWNVMERTAQRLRRKRPKGVALRLLGHIDDPRIPGSLRSLLRDVERESDGDVPRRLTLCIAINYGGRQDIVRAAQMLAQRGASVDDITEASMAECLGTAGIPDPDLIVRTSGETRLSNFLLWNAAYAELYFTDTLWPDFDTESLQQALDWYAGRKRRFGGRLETE